jgi:hypothetical protein
MNYTRSLAALLFASAIAFPVSGQAMRISEPPVLKNATPVVEKKMAGRVIGQPAVFVRYTLHPIAGTIKSDGWAIGEAHEVSLQANAGLTTDASLRINFEQWDKSGYACAKRVGTYDDLTMDRDQLIDAKEHGKSVEFSYTKTLDGCIAYIGFKILKE